MNRRVPWAPLVVYWLSIACILAMSVSLTAGRLVYALDDAYIHMAIARNLATHGVWGIDPHAFANASSSPLWILLLAGLDRILGAHHAIPLALNVAAGTGAIITGARWLGRHSESTVAPLIVGLLAAPLPAMAIVGMEHSLHLWLSALFLFAVADALAAGPDAPRGVRMPLVLMVLGALLASVRYEGLFLIAPACVMLFLRGRRSYAMALAAAAIAPLVLFALWSMSNGWHAIPNSVLLKGATPVFTPGGMARFFGLEFLRKLTEAPSLLLIVIATSGCLVSARRSWRDWTSTEHACALFLATVILHLQFADTGWFYRYEAYLVYAGILAVTPWVWPLLVRHPLRPVRSSVAFLLFFVASPFLMRAGLSFATAPIATMNIYQQQMQWARFVGTYYPGRAVVVNDIGVVAYEGKVQVVDLWGLANMETATLRRAGRLGPSEMAAVASRANAPAAVVFEKWLSAGVPAQWTRIGRMQILHNVVSGSDIVSIYATQPGEVARMAQSLQEFAATLPAGVRFLPETR